MFIKTTTTKTKFWQNLFEIKKIVSETAKAIKNQTAIDDLFLLSSGKIYWFHNAVTRNSCQSELHIGINLLKVFDQQTDWRNFPI